MLSKKDRTALINALNTALMLYVPDKESRRHFAALIADRLSVPFAEHFVDACLSGD